MHVDAFIRGDAQNVSWYGVPQLASPPLFPRGRQPGSTLSTGSVGNLGLKEMKDLGSIVMPGRLDSEDNSDIYKDHMTMVDGWGVCMLYIPRICAQNLH